MGQKNIAEPTDRKESRELYVALTQAEFNVRALDYANLDDRVAELEAQLAKVKEDFKRQIGGVESKRQLMGRVVKERRELRDVQCTWTADWASKSMVLRRDDTSEVVEARTMTPDEVQMSFDVTPKAKRLPKKRKQDDDEDDESTDAPRADS